MNQSVNDEERVYRPGALGGAIAMAFHLGCLRVPHDLNLLGKVKVVSTVSGGSVIGGFSIFLNRVN